MGQTFSTPCRQCVSNLPTCSREDPRHGNIDGLQIQALVINDPVAISKWPCVVNHIVQAPVHQKQIKKQLAQGGADAAEAVLESLNIWIANNRSPNGSDLIKLLRGFGLNRVANQLQDLPGFCPSNSCTNTTIWFQVGEIPCNFTGREAELIQIYDIFDKVAAGAQKRESSDVSIVCIVGLGGVGKSTLARKFAFAYGKEFNGNVIWIHGETTESMRESFCNLASTYLGIQIPGEMQNQEIALNVYKMFREKKCLFIFDNVEELDHFTPFKPTIIHPEYCQPCVLVTSRRSDFNKLVENTFLLDVLTLDDAVQFIQNGLTTNGSTSSAISRSNAGELADKLGRLPLALQQAIAFMKTSCILDDGCVSRYLQQFSNSEGRLQLNNMFNNLAGDSRTIFVLWDVTLNQIKNTPGGETAMTLIKLLSCLNPDKISVEFVTAALGFATEPSLKLLETFSMISVNAVRGGQVGIHRLVQQVIRSKMSLEEQFEFEALIYKVVHVQLKNVKRAELVSDFTRECMSHGLIWYPFQYKYIDRMVRREKFHEYLSDLCLYLVEYGNYAQALKIALESVEMYEKINEASHESVIRFKWRAASTYNWMKDYTRAKDILDSIVLTSKSTLGPDHWLTMNLLDLMARVQSAMGNHEEALLIYDDLIPMQVNLYGENARNSLNYMNSKGLILNRQEKYDEALELFESVYKQRIKQCGKEHLDTIGTKCCVADVYRRKGDHVKALEVYKEVHRVRFQVLGQMHPKTTWVSDRIDELESELGLKSS